MAADFEGKLSFVTGGARGVGFDVAERMVREGASVFICSRDASRLESALDRLRRLNGKVRVDGAVADVRNYADCRTAIQLAAGQAGRLDILVNNAGIGIFKPVDQLTPEEWDATIQTNLSGAFYCCREAIPIMRQHGGGHIFNVSSLLAVHAVETGTAYNASKFGLNGFSEALMQDVRYDNIRVTIIMPGSVATDFAGSPGMNPGNCRGPRSPAQSWMPTGTRAMPWSADWRFALPSPHERDRKTNLKQFSRGSV
jgi:3-oxoacyl-[acyl-carrier protein] reductase